MVQVRTRVFSVKFTEPGDTASQEIGPYTWDEACEVSRDLQEKLGCKMVQKFRGDRLTLAY